MPTRHGDSFWKNARTWRRFNWRRITTSPAAQLHEPGTLTWQCRDRLSPLNRGSLNSAHIHGTLVPVEEPSTASEPEIAAVRPTYTSATKLGSIYISTIRLFRGGGTPGGKAWTNRAPAFSGTQGADEKQNFISENQIRERKHGSQTGAGSGAARVDRGTAAADRNGRRAQGDQPFGVRSQQCA